MSGLVWAIRSLRRWWAGCSKACEAGHIPGYDVLHVGGGPRAVLWNARKVAKRVLVCWFRGHVAYASGYGCTRCHDRNFRRAEVEAASRSRSSSWSTRRNADGNVQPEEHAEEVAPR